MGTFIAVFVVLMLVVIGMSVGVIFGRPPLKGSCGGLGNVGVERACGCTDVCANEEQKEVQDKKEFSIEDSVKYYKP